MGLPTAAELVKAFDLAPHPEGGHFRESYRSRARVGDRSVSTAIYFLLPQGATSNLHRIASDEAWHFYLGGPMTLIELAPSGELMTTTLGQDIARGQKLQHVVPAGSWFGGFPCEGTAYSFVGCTVAPGFDFADFELARRAELAAAYPRHKAVIERLTAE